MASFTEPHNEPTSSSTFELQCMPDSCDNKNNLKEAAESGMNMGKSDPENIREDVLPPQTAVEAKQKWNEPRINMWRVFSCYFSFFIVGMNDGSYGVSPELLCFFFYFKPNLLIR